MPSPVDVTMHGKKIRKVLLEQLAFHKAPRLSLSAQRGYQYKIYNSQSNIQRTMPTAPLIQHLKTVENR